MMMVIIIIIVITEEKVFFNYGRRRMATMMRWSGRSPWVFTHSFVHKGTKDYGGNKSGETYV